MYFILANRLDFWKWLMVMTFGFAHIILRFWLVSSFSDISSGSFPENLALHNVITLRTLCDKEVCEFYHHLTFGLHFHDTNSKIRSGSWKVLNPHHDSIPKKLLKALRYVSVGTHHHSSRKRVQCTHTIVSSRLLRCVWCFLCRMNESW